MAENSKESVVFIASGAAAGAGVSATIGGMGLAGSFGAVGIGMAPVTAAGMVAGAAAYGAFKVIAEGDSAAFGAIGMGAAAGAGVSVTVGGMGLAGSFGAVGIGMGTMAVAGGVVGLSVYGLYKAFKQEPGQRMAGAIDAFERMESNILEIEADTQAYTQALLELDPVYSELVWKQKYAALEVEEELEALKAQVQTKTELKLDATSSNSSNPSFAASINFENCATNSAPQANQFNAPEVEAEILSIEAQPPQFWQCIKVLQRHDASVNTIAISPDGKTLASGSEDRTVSLWNLETGERIFTFFGQAGEVFAVTISPDGKTLVAGGFDNKITSWKLDTKALLRPFLLRNSPYSHSGFVSSLAFSQDRKILASASGDKTIRLWGGYTGEIKRTLEGHSDTVWSVTISPDGQTLVSGSADKTIRLWSLYSWEQPRIFTGHTGWVTSVAISSDGNILASGSTDGTIKLWNLHTGELLHTMGQSTEIFSIAISPDGTILASGSMKAIKLWNINTGESIQTLPGCSPVAFNPNGDTIVTGGKGNCIKIWRQMLASDVSDSMLLREWWEILGVARNAHPNEVKSAYRRLAWQYHPDINGSASAISSMQAINKAYDEFLNRLCKAWTS